jgi:nitrate/nitrite transporter NarK
VRNRSVGDLVGDISRDLSTLIHQEIELAKAETKQEVAKAGKAAGMLGGAGFAGYMVALFASLTLAYGIGTFWPAWTGALVVAGLWAVAGVLLYLRGREQLKDVSGPRQTVETIKEDAAWARHPTS